MSKRNGASTAIPVETRGGTDRVRDLEIGADTLGMVQDIRKKIEALRATVTETASVENVKGSEIDEETIGMG